jgi:hypothetical protein
MIDDAVSVELRSAALALATRSKTDATLERAPFPRRRKESSASLR